MNNTANFNTEEDVINFLSTITNLKSSLVDYVIRQHGRFEDVEYEIGEITTSFQNVHIDTENIISKSSQVSERLFLSIEDREKYQRQVDTLKTMKEIVMDLIVLNKNINNLQALSKDIELNVDYLDNIGKELEAVNDKFKKSSTIRLQELKAYNTLMISYANVKGDLAAKVENIWESNININRNVVNPYFDYSRAANQKDFVPHCKTVEIKMSSEVLRSLIVLLCHLDIGCLKIGLLVRFISAEIVFPSIENFKTYGIIVNEQNDKLSIMIASQPSKVNVPTRESISTFIHDFMKVLTRLSNYLLSIVIPNRNKTVLDMFRDEYFNVRLTDYLINFLSEIIFDSTALTEIGEFIEFLHTYGFISPSNRVLSDYLDDSDRRTRDNDIANILNSTRELLLKPMLDYEIIDAQHTTCYKELRHLLDIDHNDLSQLKLIDLDKLTFPSCKVSTSVVNSADVINDTIELFKDELVDHRTQIADFLQLMPEMITMYLYVVPLTNKEVLDQLPLASVIHYNNCMYLAHHCLKWITEVKLQAPALDDNMDIIYKMSPINLLCLVYRFREVAVECISHETQKQKSLISEFLEDFASFRGIGHEHKERINKAVRKCCFHLSSLSKIYDGFPDNVFDKVYGSIIDWTLDQILGNILNLPDIIQADNDEFIVLLNDIKDKVIDIIARSQSDRTAYLDGTGDSFEMANRYLLDNCSKWGKLRELIFLLENGLKAIEERWLNADSSMSKNISASEVRNMIKALFKNSNIRSKVIESIV